MLFLVAMAIAFKSLQIHLFDSERYEGTFVSFYLIVPWVLVLSFSRYIVLKSVKSVIKHERENLKHDKKDYWNGLGFNNNVMHRRKFSS